MSSNDDLSGICLDEVKTDQNNTINSLEILSIENRIIEKAEPILKLLNNTSQIINGQWDLIDLSMTYYADIIHDLNRIKKSDFRK